MPHYKSLQEMRSHFKDLHQEGVRKSANSEITINAGAADPESLNREGVSAEVTGTHLYIKLDLAPGFTTAADNEQRNRFMKLLAKYVQGFRQILEGFGGEVLEVQGGMIHGFIPSVGGDTSSANEAAHRMTIFVRDEIKPKADEDYRKCTAAFCYGETIFVTAPGSHDDLSIVSLSNSANAPAKVLYAKRKSLRDCEIVEVDLSLRFQAANSLSEERGRIAYKEVRAMAESLPPIGRRWIRVANKASPLLEKDSRVSPVVAKLGNLESPTIEGPRQFFAFCFRADLEGFTQMVADGFRGTEERRRFLATLFYRVMKTCKDFCDQVDLDVIQMPWAGDSFNLLVVSNDASGYHSMRSEEILKISVAFEDYLTKEFPDLQWSFATAGGDVDPRQICNTLVSRMWFPSESEVKSHMLTAGRPVQRALDGQIDGGVDAFQGSLWKEDAGTLNERYQQIVKFRPDKPNHQKYEVDDVRQLMQFKPAPSVYAAPAALAGLNIVIPKATPHFNL